VPRFFVPWPLPPDAACVLTGELAHRITRVLRLSPGDAVRLFDGSGREVDARIATIVRDSVTVTLQADVPSAPAGPRLHLFASLIRSQRFEWMIEKATELGAATLQPVVSTRCQVRADEFGRSKAERWVRLVIEAAEQCGRRTLPRLPDPVPFAEALDRATGVIVLPWEDDRDRAPSLGAALRLLREPAEGGVSVPELSIFIGPEGGFSPEEVGQSRQHGALVVSLGPRVLRTETAAIAALAVAQDVLG
jgi:16S rRNA (uracil1498-N3)-methyltransferase